jgi:hypothetical protein
MQAIAPILPAPKETEVAALACASIAQAQT